MQNVQIGVILGGLGVTQGHHQHNHLIEHLTSYSTFRNFVSILYHFLVIASYLLKVANFNLPTCIWCPRWV